MSELPFLDLPSDPLRRGAAHGEALREPVQACFAAHMDRILRSATARRRAVFDLDSYLARALRHRPAIERFAPELLIECEGIARAAGLTLGHILAMNLHLEWADLANPAAPDPAPAGCTTFGLVRGDGSAVIGQTYDLRSYFEDAAFCLKTPIPGGTLTALSFAGTVGAVGMNAGGVAVVINKLFGADWRIGVPYPFVVRKMLEQPTPGQALSVLIPAERAAAMHYLIADAAGLLYGIETSATAWELMDIPESGLYAHTNHFLGQRMKPLEARDFSGYAAHTIVRHARARQLLARLGRDAPAEHLQAIMADEHNFPCGICTHPSPDDPSVEGKTVARVLFEPIAGRASYAKGNRSQNPWRTFKLG